MLRWMILLPVAAWAADIATVTIDANDSLRLAVRTDDIALADKLIRAGADVKAADRYGVTPLYLACSNASVEARLQSCRR
ncbi:MAG TPA: hypothetical protein VIY49_30565 [Bryobacteraceae bacterium]